TSSTMLTTARMDQPSRRGMNSRAQVGGSSGIHMPVWSCCTALTVPPRPSIVDGSLVVGVRLGLELEGAVLDVEVAAEARAEGVEHLAAVPRLQRGVGDHDVR